MVSLQRQNRQEPRMLSSIEALPAQRDVITLKRREKTDDVVL
jgi:hypothetical protein